MIHGWRRMRRNFLQVELPAMAYLPMLNRCFEESHEKEQVHVAEVNLLLARLRNLAKNNDEK
jgi:hypothetical protein